MSIKIFISGDYHNIGSPEFIDDKLKGFIQQHDLAMCNFEAPIEYIDHVKDKINKTGPHLLQHSKSPYWLAAAGFNICCLANNHIYDYGKVGLVHSMNAIHDAGMRSIGAGLNFEDAYLPYIYESEGNRLAIINACEAQFGVVNNDNRGGYAWVNSPQIDEKIKSLSKNGYYVILIVHAGLEDTPLPLSEWISRYHHLCDIGVNAVFGHHSHIPQGYEKYNDAHIFYSLGNFYFNTCGYENRPNYSYSVSLVFKDQSIVSFKKIPHKLYNQKTMLINELHFNQFLDYLDTLLIEKYEELNVEQCIYYYKKIYLGYYSKVALGGHKNTSFAIRLLRALQLVFNPSYKQMRRDLLLLHLIRNESNRFTVQKGLTSITNNRLSKTARFEQILDKCKRYY